MTAHDFKPPAAQSAPPVQHRAALALLGHDLRAALSDVIGGLRLIGPEALIGLDRMQFERVRASGEVLARLLEQGLQVMLGEADCVTDEPQNLQVARFLGDLSQRWAGRAQEKGLTFVLAQAPDLPAVVRVDRVALDRVLSNIIGNAIKFSDLGTVACHVDLRPDGALCFVVTDDGPGFSDHALQHLFTLQGRPDGARKPGSGMGLHIAKDLTHRMGGEVSVRNRTLGGAAVEVMVPVSGGTATDPAHQTGLPDLSQVRVLLAEDSPTQQLLLSRMLVLMGAEVEVVGDGVEAVGRLERERFDLALIDVEMPRLSGLDVIRALRAMPMPVAQMPVIAVTAYVLRANRAAILSAGADTIVSKPVHCPLALGRALESALARAPAIRAVTPARHALPDLEEGRFERLLEIAGAEVAPELVARLLDDLQTVEGALVQAMTGPDWLALRAQSHVLVALAGAVGACTLQTQAETMNRLSYVQDKAGLTALAADLMTGLDGLIHFLAGQADVLRSHA